VRVTLATGPVDCTVAGYIDQGPDGEPSFCLLFDGPNGEPDTQWVVGSRVERVEFPDLAVSH
jgi:hypothetical protein